MKFVNIYIFTILSVLTLLLSSNIKFSTNFLEIFFSKESIELFSVAKKLGYSNEILISKKGFTNESLDELYAISKKLKEIPEISNVDISLSPSPELKKYFKNNFYVLSNFDNTQLTKKETLFL